MISASEVLTEVFDIVWDSPLRTAISGSVTRWKRLTNSDKEDVVLNINAHDFAQLQSALVNMNIFVPHIQRTIGGLPHAFPNDTRIDLLSKLSRDVFREEIYLKDKGMSINLQQQVIIPDEDGKSQFINNRLEIRAINVS